MTLAAGLPLMLTMLGLAAAARPLYLGFFGVGGGFLIVPTLAIALALSMPLAACTSLIIIATTSVNGLAVHLLVVVAGYLVAFLGGPPANNHQNQESPCTTSTPTRLSKPSPPLVRTPPLSSKK